jgi:NADPH-dependent 2,4-dienoyl-CoA reductase/sulfur reductase-like enzyme
MTSRLIVIGAGPVGLEAALAAASRGYDVTVLEKDVVGANLRRWGATRLFSPVRMNMSAAARRILGDACPPEDALLTGPEMADLILEPLAASAPLQGRVRIGHRVTAVGRARLTRRDLPGHPLRGERPFRLLVEGPAGEEVLVAEYVLDASGVYGQPAALGAGGIPAPGERGLNGQIIRDLGSLDARLRDLSGRDVLLVGHGHSAANALDAFAAMTDPPRITWATRSGNRRPCVEVASDPLPERERITARANAMAENPPAFLTVVRRASVESIATRGGRLGVSLTDGSTGEFDAIVGLTGYRPDLSFLSELALEIAPSSEGAARLTRALGTSNDCLAAPVLAARDLQSGEPGFHLVGAKSYGRLPTFLMQAGIGQAAAIVDALGAA